MVYYLRAIYEDMSTRLGTHANRVFKGKDINRVIQNFKKVWNGTIDKGQKIIGVEVEICQRTYSDGIKKRFFFNERDERIEHKEVFEYGE
jgi:predicted secreted protein